MTFQLFTQLFSLAWLVVMLVLLWAIWRSSQARLHHVQVMEKTLVDVAMKDAESARQAVEATRTLAAIVQNEQAKR
jgi:hypothetical protein